MKDFKSSKDKKEGVILVSRPINFLFALEVVKRNPNISFRLLIFPNSDMAEKNAINNLVQNFFKYFNNTTLHYFHAPFKKDIFNLIWFKFFLIKNYSRKEFSLISTSGGVKGRLLYRHLKFSSIIFTDEGTSSFTKIPRIIKSTRHFSLVKEKSYKLLYKILNVYDLKNKSDLTIYTMFEELQIEKVVQKITFKSWREIIDSTKYEVNPSEIIILGGNPKDLKLSIEEYSDLINNIINTHVNYNVKVKPHKTFDEVFGYPSVESELPFEYYLLKRGNLPNTVFSFGSTANYLLGFLFPQIEVRNISKVDYEKFYNKELQ